MSSFLSCFYGLAQLAQSSFDEISLDGTSVVQDGAPTSVDEVSQETKESALKLKSEANALFGRA